MHGFSSEPLPTFTMPCKPSSIAFAYVMILHLRPVFLAIFFASFAIHGGLQIFGGVAATLRASLTALPRITPRESPAILCFDSLVIASEPRLFGRLDALPSKWSTRHVAMVIPSPISCPISFSLATPFGIERCTSR